MRTVFTLINHTLTADQTADLRRLCNYSCEIINLCEIPEVKAFWSNIAPDTSMDQLVFQLDCDLWSHIDAQEGDILFVQGEAGAVFQVVSKAISLGIIPVYATTKRESVENVGADGSVVKTNVFKHIQFRAYDARQDDVLHTYASNY